MKKSIEQKYQKMSEIEHILHRPSMYIGSNRLEEKDIYLYNVGHNKFDNCTVMFNPALYKVIDEVISNSVDEFRRKDNMGLTRIDVIITDDVITVKDNGGIPVVKHKIENKYLPEFIFGTLRSSSNYDDNDDRNVIGTNGVGVKIANIFSKKFIVESADGKHEFHRSWENNMQLCDDLKITTCNKKTHYTKTSFTLDLDRFNVKSLSDDFIHIIHKRCIDAAAANPGLTVIFNSTITGEQEWKFKSFDEYLDLYSIDLNIKDKIAFKNDLCEAYIFPDSSVDIGFVNGAECSKGTHIRVLRTAINATVSDFLIKKDKFKDLSPRSVENKYSVFMNINISNPSYSSQTKEELTTPVENFSKDENKSFEITDRFLTQITKSEIVNLVRDWYKKKAAAEDEKTLRKLNKEASKGLKRSDKYVPANSKRKAERELWIYEGDSAARGFRAARNPLTQAAYTMRGVPPNCLDMTAVQIMKNDVFNDLVTILGLKFGKEFDIKDLNFGKIVISTDADVDGDKIAALLLLFFRNWPELISKHIVCRSISPIIIAKKGKDRKKYYSIDDFKKDEKKLKSGWMIKYAKGLSGLDAVETKEMMREPIYMYFDYDSNADNMFKRWFGKDSEQRKQLMEV